MPSQFFGLNIGASALAAYQASINTTVNNVSNVQTKGYTRQTANLEATDPIRVYTRYGSTGTGVAVTSITQERNLYYDEKYWQNNANKGFYEQKLYYLDQVQTILRDDDESQKGFTTIFSNMFAGLDTLKTKAEDASVRNQFIGQAQSLCTYFNELSKTLTTMQEDCNEEIKSTVDRVNSIAQKIAVLNKQINNIEVRGGHANELRDKRANLIDELSEIVDVETKEYEVTNSNGQNLGGTNYRVYINGQSLVDGNDYRTLDCISSEYLYNQMDMKGLYSIVWHDTGMDFNATGGSAGGTLKALFDVRDGNSKENMKGSVVESFMGEDGTTENVTDKNHITIKPTVPTTINELSIPNRGRITVNNKHYYYDGWQATVDTEGKITSIQYNLAAQSTITNDAELARLSGNQLVCGSSVDALGIPYYQNQANEFIRTFTQAFNKFEKQGVTLDGKEMGAFFVGTTATGNVFSAEDWDAKNSNGNPLVIDSGSDSYYQFTCQTMSVNETSLKDSTYFSTATSITDGVARYDVVENLMTLQKDVKMFRGNSAEAFLETLLSDITVDVNKTKTCSNNYTNLATSIGNQRTSISGVDEDEEALNLIKFQNAYNLASKVISVMAEMYDKLINETGV